MSDRFISVSEAAKELRVSARRIRQLIEDDELKARRIGNSWAIPAAEIHQRQRRSPRPGRPYEQENIWRLAAFADLVAHDYVERMSEHHSWRHELLERQDRAAERLWNAIAEICSFDVREVVDNPSSLGVLGRALSRAQFASRRQELLAGWMYEAASSLPEFESRAQVDPRSLSMEWMHVLDPNSAEPDLDPRSARSLRNMLMHRLGREERSIASLRGRFDQAEFYYGHPSLVMGLMDDGRLVHSGAHAAAQHGIDLVPGDNIDAYVGGQHVESVVNDHSLQAADSLSGNVVLRLVERFPDHHPRIAPRLCVAVDLLEENDPRSQDAGSQLIDALFAAISFDQLSSQWKYDSRR